MSSNPHSPSSNQHDTSDSTMHNSPSTNNTNSNQVTDTSSEASNSLVTLTINNNNSTSNVITSPPPISTPHHTITTLTPIVPIHSSQYSHLHTPSSDSARNSPTQPNKRPVQTTTNSTHNSPPQQYQPFDLSQLSSSLHTQSSSHNGLQTRIDPATGIALNYDKQGNAVGLASIPMPTLTIRPLNSSNSHHHHHGRTVTLLVQPTSTSPLRTQGNCHVDGGSSSSSSCLHVRSQSAVMLDPSAALRRRDRFAIGPPTAEAVGFQTGRHFTRGGTLFKGKITATGDTTICEEIATNSLAQ